MSGPEPFSVTEFDLVLFNDTHNHNFLILGQDVFLYLASSELKTLEWDILNPDRIINLEIKKKSGLSLNPDIHHSKVFSSGQNYCKPFEKKILDTC